MFIETKQKHTSKKDKILKHTKKIQAADTIPFRIQQTDLTVGFHALCLIRSK